MKQENKKERKQNRKEQNIRTNQEMLEAARGKSGKCEFLDH